MTHHVTENQSMILRHIKELTKKMKKSPTYREIAASTGFHVSYVYVSVKSLVRKGCVNAPPKKHRGIKVINAKSVTG